MLDEIPMRLTSLLSRGRRLGFVLFFSFAGIGGVPTYAQISVTISPIFSAIAYTNDISLLEGQEETFELPNPPLKDGYILVTDIKAGSLDIISFDKINVERNEANPRFLLTRTLTGKSLIDIPASTSGRGVIVSLFNESRTPVELRYVVFRVGARSPAVRAQLKKVVELPLIAVSKFYKMPKFNVSVAPCGTVNAFSSPDITLCSELIVDLLEKDLDNALYPILYHELAHSLLRLWRLPGYDNEDLADEFAAAMLARTFPNHIEAFIDYLESRDSTTEAVIQLTQGSRHSLSIQRARNMRWALANIEEIESRWANLLKPYEIKKSTNRRKRTSR
jgi:hypothetical protein